MFVPVFRVAMRRMAMRIVAVRRMMMVMVVVLMVVVLLGLFWLRLGQHDVIGRRGTGERGASEHQRHDACENYCSNREHGRDGRLQRYQND